MSTASDLRKAILAALGTHGRLSADDIVQGFGCPVSVARNQISTLRLLGKIRNAGVNDQGRAVYEIARPGPRPTPSAPREPAHRPPAPKRTSPYARPAPPVNEAAVRLFDVWHGRA